MKRTDVELGQDYLMTNRQGWEGLTRPTYGMSRVRVVDLGPWVERRGMHRDLKVVRATDGQEYVSVGRPALAGDHSNRSGVLVVHLDDQGQPDRRYRLGEHLIAEVARFVSLKTPWADWQQRVEADRERRESRARR